MPTRIINAGDCNRRVNLCDISCTLVQSNFGLAAIWGMRMDDATEGTGLPAVNGQSGSLFTGFAPSYSTLCPRCDYDLRGLPTVHACPECHLAFDKATRVWRNPLRFKYSTRRNTLIYLVVFSFLTFMLYLLDASGPLIRSDYRSLPIGAYVITYAGMCISLGVAIVIAWVNGMTFTKGPFVAITPDKLILRRSRFEKTTLIDWENIAEIFVTSAFASVVISEIRDGETRQYGLLNFFPTLQQLYLFCDLIEARLPSSATLYRSPSRHERLAFTFSKRSSKERDKRQSKKTNQLQRRMELARLKQIRKLHLTRCPNCEYQLRVQSQGQRCPECGLVYDQRSISWVPPRSQNLGSIDVLIQLIVLFVPMVLFGMCQILGFAVLINPLALILFGTLLAVLITPKFRLRQRHALLPNGLWYRPQKNVTSQIGYKEFIVAVVRTDRLHFRLDIWCYENGLRKKIWLQSGNASIGNVLIESLYDRIPNLEIRLCP